MGSESVWREEEMRYFGDRPMPDWEALMREGTVPALILGAERRLRRSVDDAVGASTQRGGDGKA